jgi:hypothetical protein
MSLREYRLSSHTYVSVAPEGAIFLDLKRDAYLGISPAQAQALSQLVEGWPAAVSGPPQSPEGQAPGAAHGADANAFAQSLCARGLLVHGPITGRPADPASLPVALDELVPWDCMPSDHITVGHVINFLVAWLTTRTRLHFQPLESIVRRIQLRNEKRQTAAAFDFERARLLTSAYQHIRTWVFTRKGNCLLDSLTMLEFLARYDVHAAWVIGVQVRPFAAHSWLQHDHWVLNGTPVFVRSYQPILVL